MEKNSFDEKNNINHINAGIDGFDIELKPKVKSRIDDLVDEYEQIIMKRVEHEYTKTATFPDKIADKIAAFGGSWKFIIIMISILAVWLTWNSLPFTPFHFDPGPFILLNLVLSFTAAFQAPVIMMSQNRQAARDKQESVIDFAINYKSEREIADMQGHLHRMEKEMIEIKNMLKDMQK